MAMRGYAKSVECKCDNHFTCRYCLHNAKPYFYTCDNGLVIYDIPLRGSKRDNAEETHENAKGQ